MFVVVILYCRHDTFIEHGLTVSQTNRVYTVGPSTSKIKVGNLWPDIWSTIPFISPLGPRNYLWPFRWLSGLFITFPVNNFVIFLMCCSDAEEYDKLARTNICGDLYVLIVRNVVRRVLSFWGMNSQTCCRLHLFYLTLPQRPSKQTHRFFSKSE